MIVRCISRLAVTVDEGPNFNGDTVKLASLEWNGALEPPRWRGHLRHHTDLQGDVTSPVGCSTQIELPFWGVPDLLSGPTPPLTRHALEQGSQLTSVVRVDAKPSRSRDVADLDTEILDRTVLMSLGGEQAKGRPRIRQTQLYFVGAHVSG